MKRYRPVALILLALAQWGGACARSSASTAVREADRQGGTTLRYLALGDSYTIGEGVAETECWPQQLVRMLKDDGVKLAEDAPEIIARTGWTTDELAAAIREANPKGHYDWVTLSIGVNDQFRGRSVEAYRPEFRRLLERAIALAGGHPERVLVLSIPDWGVTTFAASDERFSPERIAREIDAFNAAAQAETQKAGAAFLDVTAETRAAGRAAGELVGDGLHPSGRQYGRWAQAALPIARRALASPVAR